MQSHDTPDIPFYKVGIDIAECFGKSYLIVIDFYFRLLEVLKIKRKTSGEVIEKLKKVFSRFGIPKIVVADNNPFNSLEFKTFVKSWDIVLVTCSPNYHQSNGLAEKAVGITKNMLNKINEESGDLSLYLMNYRNTPVAGLNYSPAQLLQSRHLRTLINNFNDNFLRPKVIDCKQEIIKIKNKQINYYNRNSGKEEINFYTGEKVLVQDIFNKKWLPAVIQNKTEFPRSYIIKSGNGRLNAKYQIYKKN